MVDTRPRNPDRQGGVESAPLPQNANRANRGTHSKFPPLADAQGSAARRQGTEGPPTTYFITWVCYGTWLPGHEGAVPRMRNRFASPLPEANVCKERHSALRMLQAPYRLDAARREVVLSSLQQVCSYRGWTLLAAHVRTNHIHAVVAASAKPEQVVNAMKAYSSRALNEFFLDDAHRRRWARHGSTRYLWTARAIRAAIHYVVHEQGESMAVFEAPSPC
jgi:REP element-mobilizing transposase RayT